MKTFNLFFGLTAITILFLGFIALSKCDAGTIQADQVFCGYFLTGMAAVVGFLITGKKLREIQN